MGNNATPSHIHSNSRRRFGQFTRTYNHGLPKPILDYNERMAGGVPYRIHRNIVTTVLERYQPATTSHTAKRLLETATHESMARQSDCWPSRTRRNSQKNQSRIL